MANDWSVITVDKQELTLVESSIGLDDAESRVNELKSAGLNSQRILDRTHKWYQSLPDDGMRYFVRAEMLKS